MARPRGSRKESAWAAPRNARARALGYRDYYDYRLHDNGRIPPGPLKLTPEERERRRGHAGTSDFKRFIREGDLVDCDVRAVDRDPRTGLYRRIEKRVIPPPFQRRRRERVFTLTRLTRAQLIALIEYELQVGVIFSPQPSRDQRRLVSDDESQGGY